MKPLTENKKRIDLASARAEASLSSPSTNHRKRPLPKQPPTLIIKSVGRRD